ncbi:MAG: transposase [Treponema sp.]|nr:transposase [Treponema sp.]
MEKTVRPKYACHCYEGTEDEELLTVRIAPVEPAIIPKSIASPSLLSTIITQKFKMHLPYYRQEKQFE